MILCPSITQLSWDNCTFSTTLTTLSVDIWLPLLHDHSLPKTTATVGPHFVLLWTGFWLFFMSEWLLSVTVAKNHYCHPLSCLMPPHASAHSCHLCVTGQPPNSPEPPIRLPPSCLMEHVCFLGPECWVSGTWDCLLTCDPKCMGWEIREPRSQWSFFHSLAVIMGKYDLSVFLCRMCISPILQE